MNVAVGLGHFLWAIGGKHEFSSAVDDITVYNINQDRWYSSVTGDLTPMPLGVQGAGWALYEDKIFCFGGKTGYHSGCSSKVQVYDIASDTWAILKDMPEARSKLAKFYPVVEDHFIYLFGGDNIYGQYSRVNWNWKYDLKNDVWDKSPTDAPHVQSFPCVTWYDGWLYYTTGNTGQGALHSYPGGLNQRYHPVKDVWEVLAPCPIPVTDGVGDKWKGEFHFLGGWNANPRIYNRFKSGFRGKVKRQHAVYNYEKRSWRFEETLPGSWHHGGAKSACGYLWYYLGSIDEDTSKTLRVRSLCGNFRKRDLQHTNRIFRWDGSVWEELSPAPVRKMNFGCVYTTIGPIGSS